MRRLAELLKRGPSVSGGQDVADGPGAPDSYVPYVQKNRKIDRPPARKNIFLYATNTSNVGDLLSSPSLYFEFGGEGQAADLVSAINENDIAWREADAVVIGGGIHSWIFRDKMYWERISAKNLFAWGIGNTAKLPFAKAAIDRFKLIGVRDWKSAQINKRNVVYVPCASCMNTAFDLPVPATPEHEYVFYIINGTKTLRGLGDGCPVMDNYGDFVESIRFLSSAEVVFTDSYHGAYWATLLGRKVVVLDRREKFKSFKHPPAFASPEDWRDILTGRNKLKTWPEALEDARKANLEFYKKVMEMI